MNYIKCKPKAYTTIQLSNWKCVIDLNPREKWTFRINEEGKYFVSRDNVTFNFTRAEFDKWFKVVK